MEGGEGKEGGEGGEVKKVEYGGGEVKEEMGKRVKGGC